jgi:replicative DNA helicase
MLFSLEMSKNTLISKSLSRLTFMADQSKCKNGFHHARTSRQITTGAVYTDREKELIREALQTYDSYSQNLYIYDGMDNIGIEFVTKTIDEHVSVTGNRPVVIIDYLQILKPYNPKSSDKQNTDSAVKELKRLSVKYSIPVLAISSFNRENYLTSVSMTSFKESGAVEYTSDVLLGLQLRDMDYFSLTDGKKGDLLKKIDDMKRAERRELELKIIKSRLESSWGCIYYDFYPMFNYFQETVKSERMAKSESGGRKRL